MDKNIKNNMTLLFKRYTFFLILIGVFYLPYFALATELSAPHSVTVKEKSNIALLNTMHKAVTHTNYQMIFTSSVNGKLHVAYQYSHAFYDKKAYAKLIYLEGPNKEIVLNKDKVSYYQQDFDPFSIKSSRITEAFPSILFNDFNYLNNWYDYIFMGEGRTANRQAQLIRILPKEKDRYNYVLWLDKKTCMPLRIDLYDLNNRLIEQFKVVFLMPLSSAATFINEVKKAQDYPVLVAPDKTNPHTSDWKMKWLPKGFTEKSHTHIVYEKEKSDTRLYSDGVFSFTVILSNKPERLTTYRLQSGNQVIYVTHIFDKKITIIGDLPFKTIKKISEHIQIHPPS